MPTGPRPSPRLLTAHWTLRTGAAMCFIGHGAFGIITKKAWVPYFAVVGIPEKWAWKLMPAVGIGDITLGLLALFAPVRVFLLYMTLWCAWTAMLRPLAGESAWEAIERAGNYGVPLALLVLAGAPASARAWFTRVRPDTADDRSAARAATILRLTTALLLVGHGALASIVHKQTLTHHLDTIGAQATGLDPANLAAALGWFEILLGIAVAIRPARTLLLTAVAWKALTELLYPLTGDYIWEFIERGGSYAAPLALYLLLRPRPAPTPQPSPEVSGP